MKQLLLHSLNQLLSSNSSAYIFIVEYWPLRRREMLTRKQMSTHPKADQEKWRLLGTMED